MYEPMSDSLSGVICLRAWSQCFHSVIVASIFSRSAINAAVLHSAAKSAPVYPSVRGTRASRSSSLCGILRACIFKISSREALFGGPRYSALSILPGRNRAASYEMKK